MNTCSPIRRMLAGPVLIALALLARYDCRAARVAGGEIYMDFIGADSTDLRYRLSLDLYQLCTPGTGSLPDSQYADVRSVNLVFTTVETLRLSATDTLDGFCPAASLTNSCRNPASANIGFIRKRYTG